MKKDIGVIYIVQLSAILDIVKLLAPVGATMTAEGVAAHLQGGGCTPARGEWLHTSREG